MQSAKHNPYATGGLQLPLNSRQTTVAICFVTVWISQAASSVNWNFHNGQQSLIIPNKQQIITGTEQIKISILLLFIFRWSPKKLVVEICVTFNYSTALAHCCSNNLLFFARWKSAVFFIRAEFQFDDDYHWSFVKVWSNYNPIKSRRNACINCGQIGFKSAASGLFELEISSIPEIGRLLNGIRMRSHWES